MDPAARVELEAMQFLTPIDQATDPGDSEIQQFYQDAVIFITGGSGFIGKQLLEKLFRSCNLKKAFVLIRPKKGKSTEVRLKDMLKDLVFQPVREKKPDVVSRIVAVEGDMAKIRLGISNNDWDMITNETDIIFNVAATVRFDENIRTATMINVRGTREALSLGKACKNLKSFVHVSTAYSFATIDRIKSEVREQFYESPIPADTLLNLVDTVNEGRLNMITQSLISGWPNTYTFTKAVAEDLVRAESGNLPVCVVRPSIVLNTYREPVPGWLDASCVYGVTGIALGTSTGFLRVLLGDNTKKISFVPLDFVNNATIAAGWQTSLRGLQTPLIYTINSTRCGVTFKHVSIPIMQLCRGLRGPATLWYVYLILTKNRMLYWCLSWILHYIPAYIADALIHVFRTKKSLGIKSIAHHYRKFDKMSDAMSYFSLNEWDFEDINVQNLWKKMSNTDKIIYNFDMESIDWDHNGIMWYIGIRKYIIKDGLKGTKGAVTRQKWLKLANYAVLFGYFKILWMFLNRFRWLIRLLSSSYLI